MVQKTSYIVKLLNLTMNRKFYSILLNRGIFFFVSLRCRNTYLATNICLIFLMKGLTSRFSSSSEV